jgi:hypothetical protein
MTVYGEGGVLLSVQEPLGWGCERISGNGGKSFLALLDLRWGVVLESAFGMTSGVGKRRKKCCFSSFI